MAATLVEQYKPVADIETQADDGLSVRGVRDMADNINNGVVHVFKPMLIGQPCVPWWYSWDSNTAENVIALFAPRYVPNVFNQFAWASGYCRSAGADDIVFRLYSHESLYRGDEVMDTTYLSSNYVSTSMTCDSDTHDMPAPATANLVRNEYGFTYFVLTAQNGDGSTRGYLTSINVWAIKS